MTSGVYSALSGNLAKMEALEIFTNNLTNANTYGFKRDRFAFESLLSSADQTRTSKGINYTRIQESYIDFTPGPNHTTGEALDFAINGDGFFKVQDEDGKDFYTRQGKFHLDQNGNLITSFNMKVLSNDGNPIVIPVEAAASIVVDDRGNINAGGSEVGQIGLVNVDDPTRLMKKGLGVFTALQGLQENPVEVPQIQQGALESSNVNIVEEMALLMDGLRAFEAYQKVLKTYSTIGAKADELGTVG